MLDSVASNDPNNDYNVANIQDNPADTVSSIVWAPTNSMYMFACSDWDAKIRIYEVLRTTGLSPKLIVQKARFDIEEPCLCVSWEDDISKLFAGSIDNTVKLFDVMTGKSQNIGQHDAGVKDVYWIQQFNALLSLSFDRTLKLWDPRQQSPVKAYYIGQKIYCSDLLFPNLVMGLGNEKIVVLDLLRIDEMMANLDLYMVDSPLGTGSQLTGVSFFPGGEAIGSCSHDGRANLSHYRAESLFSLHSFFTRPRLENIMTFRAHKSEDSSTLYHVHGIGFNPRSRNLVYTAGSEGVIYFWDYHAKSKITAHNYQKTPVTKVKMSPDGIFMAYALGYDWARGVEGAKSMKTKIGCHEVEEHELVYHAR